MNARMVRLGCVCEQDRTTVRPGERGDLRYIGLESIEAGTGLLIQGELSKTPDDPQANSFAFGTRHVLYGKLRPYLNKVLVPDFVGKCSTEIVPLLPLKKLDRRFLAYFLRSEATVSRVSAMTAGARMPRADMEFVLNLELPLPPLAEQRRIVDLLSRAEGIIHLRREAQAKAQAILAALFLDTLGDPIENRHRWPVSQMSDVAEVISGVAKGRKFSDGEGVELPYMRVANVKDGYLDLAEVKTIRIKRGEVDRLLIEPGDLLMTEGGDPDKLGRAALWSGEIEACVHQNHVFKVRSNRSRVLPTYLRALAGSAYGRAYFLRVAKRTTGIASINKRQLSAFPVVLPPIELQEIFAGQVASIESIISQLGEATTKAEALFRSLLARAFASVTSVGSPAKELAVA